MLCEALYPPLGYGHVHWKILCETYPKPILPMPTSGRGFANLFDLRFKKNTLMMPPFLPVYVSRFSTFFFQGGRVRFSNNRESTGVISLRSAGDISLPQRGPPRRGLIVPQQPPNPPTIIPLTHARWVQWAVDCGTEWSSGWAGCWLPLLFAVEFMAKGPRDTKVAH